MAEVFSYPCPGCCGGACTTCTCDGHCLPLKLFATASNGENCGCVSGSPTAELNYDAGAGAYNGTVIMPGCPMTLNLTIHCPPHGGCPPGYWTFALGLGDCGPGITEGCWLITTCNPFTLNINVLAFPVCGCNGMFNNFNVLVTE